MPYLDKVQNLGSEVSSKKPNNKSNTQTNKNNEATSKGTTTQSVKKYTVSCDLITLTAGQDNPVNKLTSDLIGATLTVTDPHTLVDSNRFPTRRYTLPTTFETTISNVINETTFEIEPPYFVTDDTGQRIPVSLKAGNISITYDTYQTITTDETFKRSYADLTIGNLRTFSGDVYKAKIFTRDHGVAADYQQIYENYVIPENQLVDESSTTGYDNIGFFHTQSIIDNNWISSSTATQVDPFITLNNEKLIDGLLISGSVSGIDDRVIFRTKNSNTLQRGIDYVVRFNTYYFKSLSEQRDSNNSISNVNYASLKMYLSGSAITGQNGEDDFYLGKVDITNDDADEGKIENVIGQFRTAGSGSPKAWLKFQLDSGRFIVQDVSIEPYSEINFNPDFFNAFTPMPKPVKRNEKFDFLVEFYDSNNNLALTKAETLGISFSGSNDVIGGNDNQLEGAVTWGGSMEAYGVSGNSAYLRTIGYNGFDKTTAGTGERNGGFMLWSGSIGGRITASEAYNGVGLEVVDASDADPSNHRFLQFASNYKNTGNSRFRVQTNEFLLGISSSASNNYISGSNGRLEISSSNFELNGATGNVTLQGTITAEAGGTIGGFSIGSSDISIGNSSGDDNYISIDSSNRKFRIGQKASLTDSNSGVHIGTDGIALGASSVFKVTNAGALTATSGVVGGWTLGSTLSSTNILLDPATPKITLGSKATLTDANTGAYIGTDGIALGASSVFKVEDDGTLTATAGTIGGWTLSSTTLANGTDIVLDSNNKKITLGNGGLVIDNNSGTPVIRSATNFTSGDGFFLSTAASNNFRVGDAGGARLQFTGTNTEIYNSSNSKLVSLGASNTIAGWTIDSDKISSNNLILHSDGFIETTNYASDVKGFFLGTNVLSDGSVGSFLEVDEARIRGTLKTTVFEKETVNAVGGQLQIGNATTITGSVAVGASDTVIQVANASGFASGEVILAKKFNSTGFTTEYMEVQSVAREDASSDTNFSGSLTVLRARGTSPALGTVSGSLGGTGATGQTYSPGQVLVSTGKIGTGYIRLNANPNDQATPFMDIVERTGSGVYDIDLKTRLGDLSGLSSGLVGTNPGFGLFTEKLFLRASTASSASIAIGSATDATTGTGLYMDGSGVFRVGNPSGNQVYWNGSTLAITGDITVSNTEDFVQPNETGSFTKNSATSSLENPSNYSFGGDATFSLNALPGSITTAGLYLGSNNLGYHDGSVYKSYMDSSGRFYLGGTSGALQWNGSSLTITGNISFTNSPNISTFTNDTGFTDDTVANSKPSVFRQTSAPSTSSPVGSLWYDTDDDNKLYVLVSGTPNVWTATQDGDIATAQSAANAAQTDATTALTRPKVFRQTSAPSTSEPGGSLWYDTDDDNKLYILVSSTWTATRDGQITTALADAAAAQSTANTANSTANTVSSDLQDVIDGVSVSGTGTFIDANVIYSPLIAGTNGYISNVFKVGNAGITLDGVNKKIYIGTGTYNNSNTAFYVDNSNNFSLGDKLSWNGSALSVTGTINATAGNFTSTVSVGESSTQGTLAVGTAGNKINIIGTDDASTTAISASNNSFALRADGTATFAGGEITFESNGDISSQTFLLEKTRLFGAGGDGAIVLKSGDCTVDDTGDGAGTKVSNASIQDARGDTVCTRSGTTWTMKGDWYTTSFEVDNSTGATTLNTNGYRLFVKGAMVIDSSCVVHNDGSDGSDGANSTTTGTTSPTQPTAGGAGGGEAGCSLGGGPDGQNGSRGGQSDAAAGGSGTATYWGAAGGGGGGGGGIVFISCRTITNNGTIRSNGGDGGNGGEGGRDAASAAGNGTAGGNGSVVHVVI